MQPALVRFTVLGAVRAWRGDVELELGPPQQRAVLALLLARGGQPTGLNELVDLLWPACPPASAVNIVHRYVGVLRRVLEPGLPPRAAGRWLVRHCTRTSKPRRWIRWNPAPSPSSPVTT